MDGATALVTAILGGVGIVITAVAALVKAWGAADNPKRLLRRLWDWIENAGLDKDVPPRLAGEIRNELNEGDNPP